MNLTVFSIVFIYFLNPIKAARILGVFPGTTYSHFILGHTLMKELASRGHQVTMISPFPQKTPIKNFEEVDISEVMKIYEAERHLLFTISEAPPIIVAPILNYFVTNATTILFEIEPIQQFLKSERHYDLVIIEEFLVYISLGFCDKYKAPCISFSATGLSWLVDNQVGNPISPSYIPNMFTSYTSNMDFFQRLSNSIMHLISQLVTHLYTLPKQNEIMHRYFPTAPHITELYYNLSLILINSNVGTHSPVPLVPNLVDVGGLHITPPKKLPDDIQEYLDNAKDGVIYFSLGSNLRSSEMPIEKQKIILETFRKLKQKVLWKFEDEELPDKPSNVKISKWFPQSDLLAHPNVKLFITHGGLLSTVEAIYHGVPMIGIPFYGDQKMNVVHADSAGFSRSISFVDVTKEKLVNLIQEVLENPKYRENAKLKSRIMRDQPMKPLDKAVFWVEYVLRHKGAPHLRTAALNLSWYQYLLLDVLAFVLSIIVILFTLIRKLLCCKKKSEKVLTSKKRN